MFNRRSGGFIIICALFVLLNCQMPNNEIFLEHDCLIKLKIKSSNNYVEFDSAYVNQLMQISNRSNLYIACELSRSCVDEQVFIYGLKFKDVKFEILCSYIPDLDKSGIYQINNLLAFTKFIQILQKAAW
jgi:hypothetical protein